MEKIVLIIHLVLCFLLIISVLIQKSEGGGLNINSSPDQMFSFRSSGNFLTKFTTVVALLFITTSISLTLLSKKDLNTKSVIDKIQDNGNNKLQTPKIPSTK